MFTTRYILLVDKPFNSLLYKKKILDIGREKESWIGVCLILEICLCSPYSNAALERLFSQLKLVKTDQRTRLSAQSLNSVLRIKMKNFS